MESLFSSFFKRQAMPKSVEMKLFSDVSSDNNENLSDLNSSIEQLYDHPNSNTIARELDNIHLKIKDQLDYCVSKRLWRPTTVQVLCLINNQWQTIIVQELNGAVELSLKGQVGRRVILEKIKNIPALHEELKQKLSQNSRS